eukprot:COSAG04_NODE_342_length_16268_cov_11.873214_4_plen_63_part_00
MSPRSSRTGTQLWAICFCSGESALALAGGSVKKCVILPKLASLMLGSTRSQTSLQHSGAILL